MISVTVSNRKAVAVALSPVTSGAVGVPVEFTFSDDWEGLEKIAVFRGSSTECDVALYEDACTVPWEVLANAYGMLDIGVYGSNEAGTTVIPTVWASPGRIEPGTAPSEVDPQDPTPSWAAQVQADAEAAAASAAAAEAAAAAAAPTIEITEITGGHRVTIYDEEHPEGQSFDVMDGAGGTYDYEALANQPKIEGVTLTGNKTASDLGLAKTSDIPTVPVQSVNSKTGAVVLTASDVGAYAKPSGGIPKTDLASAVQTSLEKADSALQSAPVSSVNGKTGAVTLSASDVGAYEKPSGGIPSTDMSSAVVIVL